MDPLILTNATIITPLAFRFADLLIKDGIIAAIGTISPELKQVEQSLDVTDCYITPGLIDLQVNGGRQCDFWAKPTKKAVEALSLDQLRSGVTTILPTLITDDIKSLQENIARLKSFGAGCDLNVTEPGAQAPNLPTLRLPGIHLEGPCLSPARPGVHPRQYLQPLNLDIISQLADDAVKLITLAPELDPTCSVVDYLLKKNIVISLGHSNATFAEAQAAFDQGIKMFTHIFNASPPLHHRDPGAVACALLDTKVSCCLIADGLHLDPATIRLIVKMKGLHKTILVSDAAHIGTNTGGLVGSSISLNQAVKNMVSWQIATFPEAIRMATWNPAAAINVEHKIGHIEPGKLADLTIWNKKSLEIEHVVAGGVMVF